HQIRRACRAGARRRPHPRIACGDPRPRPTRRYRRSRETGQRINSASRRKPGPTSPPARTPTGGSRLSPGRGIRAGHMDPVVDRIVVHVARVGAGELPEAARDAAKTFIADSLAVGIGGAAAPWRREVLDMAAASGGHPEATGWGSG